MRLIAFYLPQYHPIPENDRWWGPGFTEWRNVARGRPLFRGHEQPHEPGELGYYDLRAPETRIAQAELARAHGISGFCYYHYWFSGKRLLERPFDDVLASGRPDFPFCLCWANENWTRAWDGQDRQILIGQDYSPEDDRAHIRWLASAFADPRYIRVAGRPLMLIYRATRLPSPRRTIEIWRDEARRLGVGELHLCRVESFPDERGDPRPDGFDAAVEFAPDWLVLGPAAIRRLPRISVRDAYKRLTPQDDGQRPGLKPVHNYRTLARNMLGKPPVPYRRYPCVTPCWDNTARWGARSIVLGGSTPQAYGQWLCATLERVASQQPPENQIVFVNAWNEWGEGNHLEPDVRHGRAYLDQTRRAMQRSRLAERGVAMRSADGAAAAPKVSVIVPNYNHARFLKRRLDSIVQQTLEDFELIVLDDASTDHSLDVIERYADDPRMRFIAHCRNSGSPFCQWDRGIHQARGQYIWIAESDDDAHREFLQRLVEVLDKYPSVGVAYCRSMIVDEQDQPLGLADRYVDYLSPGRWETDFVADGRTECRDFLFQACTIPNASGVVFRRALYQRVGGVDLDQRLTGDWRLWMKMLAQSDLAYIAQPMNQFRTHRSTVRAAALRGGTWLLEQAALAAWASQRMVISDASVHRVVRDLAQRWAHWATQRKSEPSVQRRLSVLRGLVAAAGRNRRLFVTAAASELARMSARSARRWAGSTRKLVGFRP